MTIDPGGSGGSRTRKPFPSIRTTRTLLLAGGLVVTPPGVATMVAAQQTSAAVGSAPSATADTSNAAQRSQKADQAVSQLPAASTDPSGAAQRLQGADDGVSQLLNEVPAYLPHTYHSALTAPGSDTLKALPQADLPQELPLTDAQQSVSQSDSQQAVPLASKKPPPPQSLSCRSTNVYDRGAIPVTIPQREADRDPAGCEGSFQPAGAAGTAGNAFFASLGTNGRTCATCHQPPSGMSVSVANIEARYGSVKNLGQPACAWRVDRPG